MAEDASAGRAASPGARFAAAKFRPTTLPATLVTRPGLHDRLTAGASQRLTVVVGSAGAGKSVLSLLRAARWFEATGDARRAARHFLAARQVDPALALLQDRVLPDFLNDPVLPRALDLSTTAPSLLAQAPGRLLGLATDLLLMGDAVRGGQYLDLLEHAQPPIAPESRLGARLAAVRSFRYAMAGQAQKAAGQALAARAIQRRTQLADEWDAAAPLILLSVYTWLEDYEAVDREAAMLLAIPELSEPARLVNTVGAQALAWFEAGRLAAAADAAQAARKEALRLGFDRHFFAQDYLRVLAGLALERRETRHRRAAHRAGAVDNRAPAAPVRVPGAAGPGRDLGRPRAGPRSAGHRRGGSPDPGRNRVAAPGPR